MHSVTFDRMLNSCSVILSVCCQHCTSYSARAATDSRRGGRAIYALLSLLNFAFIGTARVVCGIRPSVCPAAAGLLLRALLAADIDRLWQQRRADAGNST